MLLWLCACNNSLELAPADYVWYMEQGEHDLVRKVTAGAYEYSIQLATPEYMACKQEAGNDSAVKTRISELKGYLFFIIKMSATEAQRKAAGGAMDAERVAEAGAMVAYYDGQAAGDISLHIGSQTLKPATYHFEHNYGLAPHNTIIVAFKTGTKPQDLELVFNDRFRDVAHIQAAYSQLELSSIPSLKM